MTETMVAVPVRQPGIGARALRSPMGCLATGWWIDGPALVTMVRGYFPLSRLWAAADLADGDVDRFAAAAGVRVPGWLRGRTGRALARVASCRQAARRATMARDAAFWADVPPSQDGLAALERTRLAASHRYMNSRLAFSALRACVRTPPIRLEIPAPAEVFEQVADGLHNRAAWFHPPGDVPIAPSHPLATGPDRRDYWLRLRSPVMGDEFTVRVHEPVDVTDPPTVIYGSGIGMETDQWCDPLGDFGAFVGRGMRLVEVQAPWHGARRMPGYWSGEPFFSTAPLGPIRFFRAQAQETAALISWARQTSAGPVALAGVSLGALAAQVIADNARDWSADMRPDAMLLLAAADRLDLLTFDSALTRGLGLDRALTRAGWTPDLLAQLRSLTDPIRPPVMAPGKVIMVLGTRDSVTPYARGAAMARGWGVPADNLFVGRRGHFSTPINLLRDQRPIARLAAVMR